MARLSFREISKRTNVNLTTVMKCGQAKYDNAQNRRILHIGRRKGTIEV